MTTEFARSVGAQLRAERAAAGLTRDELAEAAGVSVSTVRRIEGELRPANMDQIAALCAALGLNVSDFLSRAAQRIRKDASDTSFLGNGPDIAP